MTDRDGLKAFEAWLKVYVNKPMFHPPSNAPLLTFDLREAWVQGVAWGRANPKEQDGGLI